MATVTIRRLDEDDPTALHHHYQGELAPQDCYIELDTRDGEMTADWNGEIGNAVPFTVWHNIVLRWSIPCYTAQAANELMDELLPLAERVYQGSSIEWDGNNNVGRFDDDAQAALDEIYHILDDEAREPWRQSRRRVCEWDACDWFSEGDTGVTAETTDEELERVVQENMQAARDCDDDGYGLLVGAREYLEERREELRREYADQF